MVKVDNLILLRHAQPDEHGVHITDRGRAETFRLASQILIYLGSGFIQNGIALLTSDSSKAVETTEIIGGVLGIDYEEVDQLSEGMQIGINVRPKDFEPFLLPITIMVTHGGSILPIIKRLSNARLTANLEEPGYGGGIAVNTVGQVRLFP